VSRVWWVMVAEGDEVGMALWKCREELKTAAKCKAKKKRVKDCDGPVTMRHKRQNFVTDCDGPVTNYDNFLICDGLSVTNFESSVTNFPLLTCVHHSVTKRFSP